MDQLGAQLYTVRSSMQTPSGIKNSLKKVADIGYRAVQLSGQGPIDPRELARMIEDNDLTVAATHMNWQRFLNDIDAVIEEHKILNCRHSAIGGIPEDYRSLEGLDRFLSEVGPVAETLRAEGIDFSYHNHSQELARYGDQTWLEMLYSRSDPELLKAELDVYWIQAGGGDPALWIEKIGDRQPLLHLKDMAVLSNRQQRFAEIGQGNMNWDRILESARNVGARWYLVEQDSCYDRDPFDSLAISYHFLKGRGLS